MYCNGLLVGGIEVRRFFKGSELSFLEFYIYFVYLKRGGKFLVINRVMKYEDWFKEILNVVEVVKKNKKGFV